MAAVAGVYRRVLPSPPAIEFASSEGKQLFAEALGDGNLEGFFKLMSYYQTQSEPAYCGLATLAMVLNALGIDPGRKWKGPWRWFDDAMLDCCEPLEKVKVNGISFGKVACLAHCNGANVEAFRTTESALMDFRKFVMSCTSSEDCHIVVSYNRKYLKQTGSGHFSPIGGYHAGRDLVLILDVARFKYPPHWVPLSLLWEAMNTVDEATGHHRGFMLISRLQRAPSILYTLSCRHGGWDIMAKYLTEEIPCLLSTKEIKDIQEMLSVILTSAPIDLGEIINWIAEVRKQEDGSKVVSEEEMRRLVIKEDILKQVRDTELHKYITRWILCKSCCDYAGQGSLREIAFRVCCEGANLLSGKVGTCNRTCCTTTNSSVSVTDNEKFVTVISGKVIVENANHGVEMLVPCCEWMSNGISGCDSNTSYGKHSSADDVLTILILALPPDTWSTLKDERLREVLRGIVSIENLPHLLQQEVLHLRRQLHYLTTDLHSSTS